MLTVLACKFKSYLHFGIFKSHYFLHVTCTTFIYIVHAHALALRGRAKAVSKTGQFK